MCGLVAYVTANNNGFSYKQIDVFEEMLKLNQLRGDDSTGVVWVDKKEKWAYAKKVGAPNKLMGDNTIWPGVRADLFRDGRLIFGHGRAATRGTVTIENAHPFKIERADKSTILLIHNGTLSYTQTLPGFDEHDVDSEWLAKMVAERGPEEAFREVRGAIATMWWDERDNSFNIYRNFERPLCILTDKQGNVYLNSERTVLEYIAFKNKLEYETAPYDLKPFNWAKMVPGSGMGFINTEIARPVVTYTHNPAAVGGAATQSHFPHTENGGRRRKSSKRPGSGESILTTDPSESNPYDEGTDEWMLVEGYCSFIEWKRNENGKWIKSTYYTGGTFEGVDEEPPIPGLVKMYYRQQKRQIIEIYVDDKNPEGPGLMSYRSVDEAVMELEAEAMREADEALAKACMDEAARERILEATDKLAKLGAAPLPAPPKQKLQMVAPMYQEVHIEDLRCTFRPGRAARWHTKVPGQNGTIRHNAISDDKYAKFFKFYKNDVDGEYQPGKKVNLEYYYSEVIDGSENLKAYCCTMREKQEVCVDLVFFTNKYTKQQLQKIKHFQGTIKWVRVMEQDEREKQTEPTGGIIQCYVGDVVPYVSFEADDGAGVTC